jgi:hypothetical protein
MVDIPSQLPVKALDGAVTEKLSRLHKLATALVEDEVGLSQVVSCSTRPAE